MDLGQWQGSVGFVGAGNMASALISGMIAGGLPAERITVTDLDPAKTENLQKKLFVKSAVDAGGVARGCTTVIVAVKPGSVVPLLQSLRNEQTGQLWISVAAGVRCEPMESALGSDARVVRAMPNTPALLGEGATGLAAGSHATDEDLKLAADLLSTVGLTEVVAERWMDALTGLSGSGPAFVMLMMEALADGAVHEGLPRETALRFAAQTVRGAATLLQQSGKHPGQLKDMVTSPAGTTIAGVRALEGAGFRSAVMEAVIAAASRSKKLSS